MAETKSATVRGYTPFSAEDLLEVQRIYTREQRFANITSDDINAAANLVDQKYQELYPQLVAVVDPNLGGKTMTQDQIQDIVDAAVYQRCVIGLRA